MYGGVPSDDVHAFGRASGMYIHLELLSTIFEYDFSLQIQLNDTSLVIGLVHYLASLFS